MLRKNALFIKLFKIKTPSFSFFRSFMDVFRPELETCPVCGQKSLRIHSYYGRTVTDFLNGRPTSVDVSVMRVKCESCGHTHAVLPDCIVPYSTHSLFFILRVLTEYFLHLHSVMFLCERFQISVKRLYAWLHLFKRQKAHWLGILEDLSISSRSFLTGLARRDRFSDFASDFYRLESRSFLQTHANPHLTDRKAAYSCQSIFSPDYSFEVTT